MAEFELPGPMAPGEILRTLRTEDVIVLRDWERQYERRERNQILKAIYDSKALVLNGAGMVYVWPIPLPWEHDGTVPGSALT